MSSLAIAGPPVSAQIWPIEIEPPDDDGNAIDYLFFNILYIFILLFVYNNIYIYSFLRS
jgi:hypothetical protein